ncbi:MAG: aldo/keto reductase [Anaerolineaceae bacterium]|nr:aldo/keto reductase [Ruminococcus sp.]MBQ6344285.1 aldo/keto reductase [Anaerolineaceae bacterium]
MNYRNLGKTGLKVSEIGFGGEWLERHDEEESVELLRYAGEKGINIIDCWMPDPKSRDIIGKAMKGNREKWIVQGHIGSTYQNGQYVRTRDMKHVVPAFEDILKRMDTDHIDLGMIHYIDAQEDWDRCMGTDYIKYVHKLHDEGVIRHIGLSTHNPRIAKQAVETGFVEMILFSINPAFDMRPATEDLDSMFEGYDKADYCGIDPERAALYRLCEEKNVGITVMKGFFGGRLFDEKTSPFGTAFTPVQCIHYALTRPGVSSILCGYDTKEQVDEALSYETATEDEKDYASVIAKAPLHSYTGQCTYCGHCKPCPMNIDIAMVNKFYDLAVQQDTVPESVRSHYEALGATASACIGCKSCESRCPFGVAIADRMQRTKELFGV